MTDVDTRPAPQATEAGAPHMAAAAPIARRPWPLLLVAVGLLGFTARFVLMSRGGGLLGVGAYDDGVYYAAAAQLLHGHLPYRDYLFLQPPGIVLALTPFAALGRLIGDPAALVALRVGFEVIGGLNAVLVAANLRRFGFPAAVAGGVFYAVFFPAVYDERTALLEPLGTTGVLAALLLVALVHDGRLPARWLFAAGAAAGLAVDFKIWYAVALLIAVAFAGPGRLKVLIGGAAATVVVYLPFFLASPPRAIQQIVLDQLGRSRSETPRLASLLGVDGIRTATSIPHVSPTMLALGLAAVVVALAAVALTDRRAWVFVALLATGTMIALTAPSYFLHYAALTAPPLALVLGAATGLLVARIRRRPVQVAAVAMLLVTVAALNVRHDKEPTGQTVPIGPLQAAAAHMPGCVLADDPTVLALMNVLTRDLDRGCTVQVDVSGISFDPAGLPPGSHRPARKNNEVYQQEVVAYLRSGDAFLATRRNTALSAASKHELARNAVLARSGSFVLRAGGTPR
jgi:alpha-1,2-mannosyltransferase